MKKISVEEVKSFLKKKGTEISLEEAEMVLGFLRKMSHIVVVGYLDKKVKKQSHQ